MSEEKFDMNKIPEPLDLSNMMSPDDIIRKKIADREREKSLVNYLAYIDCGLAEFKKERDLAEFAGMPIDKFREFRDRNRASVERIKDEIRNARHKLIQGISSRQNLIMAFEQAMVEGDKFKANDLMKMIKVLNRVAPLKQYKELVEILKETLPEVQQEQKASNPTIVIQNDFSNAERLLEERKRKAIDVK